MNDLAPLDPSARANVEQLAASDPGASALVAAHAGTGKTKLLIDRLLRLMLAGADPRRIQCLTFTKAAAAEMAIRLQRRLGAWVTLDEPRLDDELTALRIPPSPGTRERARRLFATVLDLPGGMRIGTIHAFCQSLLRRFPLEAQLSPHFRLLDDADGRASLEAARERSLLSPDTRALEVLAGLASARDFSLLVATLQGRRGALARVLSLPPDAMADAVRRAAGARHATEAAVLADAVHPDEATLRPALLAMRDRASPAVRDRAGRMLGWLGLDEEERVEHWERWREELLTAAGTPRATVAFCNAKLAASDPWIAGACLAEAARVVAAEDERRAVRLAEATIALLTLAAPVLREHAGDKDRVAALEYDDLISRTAALLFDPGAAWVLYKLDGGLDHLLLDEVQDNSGAQWHIADALSAEFFAGSGAHEDHALRGEATRGEAPPPARTVFAVGDRKQSIYSFQGAEPAEFDRFRGLWRERVHAAGRHLAEVTLDVSFRSAPAVLDVVDAVFARPDAADGVRDGEALHHLANRVGAPGRVELWPLAPAPEPQTPEPWAAPERNAGLLSGPQRLAEQLAAWIGVEAARGTAPGDVLVLVRRRGEFARALVRALKGHGVPVAGLDRLVLTDQPAVQDLLALCDALLLPGDDLSLACVLTSPLGALTDEELMPLATERRGSLWEALEARARERPCWGTAHRFLVELLGRVDYTTPHALLAEALGPLGGRARLLARLGPEAAEPIDELLGAALAHARQGAPSLQGFVHALRRSGAEVKREPQTGAPGGGAVRIMTVHGAKGLQAPLVVLPDTTALPREEAGLAWTTDPADPATTLPLWAPRRDLAAPAVEAARDAERLERRREHNRLLYVALTRAQDRLVVCGWRGAREPDDGCWFRMTERALRDLGASETPFDAWPGTALVHARPGATSAADATAPATPPPPDSTRPDASPPETPALPEWAGSPPSWRARPPPPEPVLPHPLAPSRPEGVELGPVPRPASPLDRSGDRFRRGLLIHTLLQHLPALPPSDREPAALRHAHAALPGDPDAAARAAAEALGVLDVPALAPLFGPLGRAEQPLAGVIGDRVVTGQVDRLAVLPDEVLLADFKSDRDPPAIPAATPVTYLRQMAAYRAVLSRVWPDRPVRCLLVWTRGPTLTTLPDALLDEHAPDRASGP